MLLASAALAPGQHGAAVASPPLAVAEKRRVDARTGALEIPLDELLAAVRRKDRAETARLAERIGPARLGEALGRKQDRERQPAVGVLAAIPHLPGAVRLVGPMTDLLGSGDEVLVTAAARGLGEVLSVSPAELEEWEVPPDVVAGACASLRAVAAGSTFPVASRLAALETLADAAAVCTGTAELAPLLRDPSAAVRRAAALVMKPQDRPAGAGAPSSKKPPGDDGAATAIVGTTCEALAARPGREAQLAEARESARALALSPATPVEDAVQMLDCLDPRQPADRRALEALKARPPSPLRDRAREILERPAAPTRPRTRP